MSQKILVVDDEENLRKSIRMILEEEGYQTIELSEGKKIITKVYEEKPDLILLDFMMPDIAGDKICQILRQDLLYSHLPIIMLTAKGQIEDKLVGMKSGIDDYLVKPIHPEELIARVKMILQRSSRYLDANPLTKLPGNTTTIKKIEEGLRKKEGQLAIMSCDLNSFKSFNDKYGFERGDEVIKLTAHTLINAVQNVGNKDDFIGHIGGDDFIVISTPDKAELIAEKIIEEFDQAIPYFYDPDGRKKGYIVTTDRMGNIQQFPIMSISVTVVTNEEMKITHPGQISRISAELRKYAKTFGKSVYVRDRRLISGEEKKINHEPALWKELSTMEAKEHLFDKFIRLPTIPLIIEKVQNFLSETDHIGMIYLKIVRYEQYPEIASRTEFDEVIKKIMETLHKLQEKIFRKEDILAISRGKENGSVIFLCPARRQAFPTEEQLEEIKKRIQNYLEAELEKTLSLSIRNSFGLYWGEALITKESDLPLEKIIYDALKKSEEKAFVEEQREWQIRVKKLKEMIETKTFSTLFQPIVSLSNFKDILGYEVLTRGPTGGILQLPSIIFPLAQEMDLLWEAENLAQENALLNLPKLNQGQKLFFNLKPQIIEHSKLRNLKIFEQRILEREDIVLEMSENEILRDFRIFRNAVEYLKIFGFKIAIDDVQAFYSQLYSLKHLHPEFVKLDISLVRDVDKDLIKQELIATLLKFFQSINSEVIAEGIEREEEYKTLLKQGVKWGQGFFLAEPSSI